MAKQRTIYCCSECGMETANWAGKCPHCGSWNTLKEIKIAGNNRPSRVQNNDRSRTVPKKLQELDLEQEIRFSSGISELDRVLGGGVVIGSLVLVGGTPGIGKSTLLLQVCGTILQKTILYVTGEESERQIRLRSKRLNVISDSLYVFAETDLDRIRDSIDQMSPDIVIIDSIQTIYDPSVEATPGSPSQIRETTMQLMRITKEKNITVFLVGHVTKEGNIAGPKLLEHMVDCVLYFEGERDTNFRILRAVKNRFGSTNEIGVFEMNENGLQCVDNPSEMLLSGRPENSSGTCVTCVMEGTRPILSEVQALVSQSGHSSIRRSNGIDYNRMTMLLAVLEKRAGMPLSNCDAFINVVGGLVIDETAADLAAILALASSYLDRTIGKDVAAIGEVGLSGEIRQVSSMTQRLSEIQRLGFQTCVIPETGKEFVSQFPGLNLISAKNIYECIQKILKTKRD